MPKLTILAALILIGCARADGPHAPSSDNTIDVPLTPIKPVNITCVYSIEDDRYIICSNGETYVSVTDELERGNSDEHRRNR